MPIHQKEMHVSEPEDSRTAALAIAQAAIVNETVWQSATGPIVIQTCADGSTWVNGKPVRDLAGGLQGSVPQPGACS